MGFEETIRKGLPLPMPVTSPEKLGSIDGHYGVYNNVAEALQSMAKFGDTGRQVLVWDSPTKDTFTLYLYNSAKKTLVELGGKGSSTAPENMMTTDGYNMLGEEFLMWSGDIRLEFIGNTMQIINESAGSVLQWNSDGGYRYRKTVGRPTVDFTIDPLRIRCQSGSSTWSINNQIDDAGNSNSDVVLPITDGTYPTLATTVQYGNNKSVASNKGVLVLDGLGLVTKTWVEQEKYLKISALNGYAKEDWVSTTISDAIVGAYKIKPTVDKATDLPASGNKVGDVRNVVDTGMNYVWTGTEWDALGSMVDLSGYATESWVTSKKYLTQASLSSYATQTYVTSQGYLKSADLLPYATVSYVTTNFLALAGGAVTGNLELLGKLILPNIASTAAATKVVVIDKGETKYTEVANLNKDAVSKSTTVDQEIKSVLKLLNKLVLSSAAVSTSPMFGLLLNALGEVEKAGVTELLPIYTLPTEITQAYINVNYLNATFIAGPNRMVGDVNKPALYVNMGTFWFDIVEKVKIQ